MSKVRQSRGKATSRTAVDAGGQKTDFRPHPKKNQADQLVELCRDVELFQSDKEGYASIKVGNHTETYKLRSTDFKTWLRSRFYQKFGKTPQTKVIDEAVGVLEGKGQFGGPRYPVYVRLGRGPGAIYLDLGDAEWRVVEITSRGWKVLPNSPVKFRRPKGMKALPDPIRGGAVKVIRPFINVGNDSQFKLVVGFVLGCFRPEGPYPILEINGEQGSAKSTLSQMLRELVDPHQASKKSPPKDERDLMIASVDG